MNATLILALGVWLSWLGLGGALFLWFRLEVRVRNLEMVLARLEEFLRSAPPPPKESRPQKQPSQGAYIRQDEIPGFNGAAHPVVEGIDN